MVKIIYPHSSWVSKESFLEGLPRSFLLSSPDHRNRLQSTTDLIHLTSLTICQFNAILPLIHRLVSPPKSSTPTITPPPDSFRGLNLGLIHSIRFFTAHPRESPSRREEEPIDNQTNRSTLIYYLPPSLPPPRHPSPKSSCPAACLEAI